MELWIRSKNKLSLTKVNSVIIDYNNQKSIVANYMEFNDSEDYTPLGEYDTEERALEVLDEIQSILKPKLIVKCEADDSSPIITGEWANSIKEKMYYDIQKFPTYVYEMPQE